MGKQAARVLIDIAGHMGPIIAGSPNVWIGGMPAARQGDGFTCSSHGIGSITDGELTVLINGKPAARMGDKTCCATPPDPPIVGSPPKGEHVTAAENADKNGIVHENENSPDWVDIDAKAMYAGYEISDSNKDGTYDTIKGQVSALDMESHFGNDYVGSTLDLQVLHAKGEARAGWGDGYYGANSSAEAKVAGGTIDAHLGDKDSRIAYAEAKGDLFYAEHELTGETYTGGEEKKYGLKIRTKEQAGIARGSAGVGTDMLKGKTEGELKDDKGRSMAKGEAGIPTEASVGGAVGAVGWDVGLETYADLDKCNLVAQLDIGLAAVLGIDLHIGGSINYKPLKDFWGWIWGTDEPEVLTGVIITGCPTVLIGPDTVVKSSDSPSGFNPKQAVADFITSNAERAHDLYLLALELGEKYPWAVDALMPAIEALGNGAELVTDTNPETMGWEDLTSVWLFEKGNYDDESPIIFGPNAKTTQDMKKLEGAQQAREKALEAIRNGDTSTINHTWKYGQNEFYDGIKEGNVATSFLGSYGTEVQITPNPDGSYTLDYTASNTTGWASGTRLRKDNDGNGVHDAIIPDKKRGEGIPLGGNLKEIWQWSETVNP